MKLNFGVMSTSFAILIFIVSCTEKQHKTSKSYSEVKSYLASTKIDNPGVIFFYEDKPRMPMPNVYCFDSNGVQLVTPPQCFGYLKDYIILLGDSIMPAKLRGQKLAHFIDSVHIMNAYDERLDFNTLEKSDYYLFVDFISISEPGFQETLYNAVKYSSESKRKIKLFLVHALSEKNAKYFRKKEE